MNIGLDCKLADRERREAIFRGDLLLHSRRAGMSDLCSYARCMIEEGFGDDPERAQEQQRVADFVAIAGPLKSRFTNDAVTRQLVRAILEEFACDLSQTYFDVPRLRVVTSNGYLTSGVGYAYRPHRDTWYSSPQCQVNWWAPVFALSEARSLALFPRLFDRPVENTSGEFDYSEWCRIGRNQALNQGTVDTRKHPLPSGPLEHSEELRVTMGAGESLLFSGAHLHATVPNTSGLTRFSLDFRTVNLEDLAAGAGAPNVDCGARGTTLGDFLRAEDFTPMPERWAQAGLRRAA